MIKSYTVVIDEIDDADEAVRQAVEKVAACPLMASTVGIVLAHPEFVSSGICERVMKALPFPATGMTSISHCAGGTVGTYMMSITIMTSDDCRFASALSDAAESGEPTEELTRKCYEDALRQLDGEPKLAILYAPFFDKSHVGGFVINMTALNGKLPIFGAISNDDKVADESASGARVLYNGEACKDRYALTLVSGAVDPKFYIVSVTEEATIMPNVGIITSAAGNKALTINGMNATQFLKDAGFITGDPGVRDKGMLSSIFVLKLSGEDGGGITLSRIPTKVDDEGVYCGGQIVEGAMLSIAFNTKESVLETAEQLTAEILEDNSGGTVLINTCLGRRFGLLNEPMRELEVINEKLGKDFSCTGGYANGELCPIAFNENGAHNQDHNQTLIACVI